MYSIYNKIGHHCILYQIVSIKTKNYSDFQEGSQCSSSFSLCTRKLFEHVEWHSVNVLIICIALVSLDFTNRSPFILDLSHCAV